jgi:DNA-directed RNA polymerase subunit RPC12/RpoP
MSLEISLDNRVDPFARKYEECSRCGGRLALRVENLSNGSQHTSQVCRKCSHKILTTKVNVIRV